MQEDRVYYVDICDESSKKPVWVASQWGNINGQWVGHWCMSWDRGIL
jgi:hypothetical protein